MIEDPSTIDQFIIDFIQSLVYTNEEARGCFQFCQYGSDHLSLLHLAAKQCRPSLCEYLIDELLINKNVKTNTQMTPLHLLIQHNVIERSIQNENETVINEDSEEENDKSQKKSLLKKDKLKKTDSSANKDEQTYKERIRINVNFILIIFELNIYIY